jgi:hypothetical protein
MRKELEDKLFDEFPDLFFQKKDASSKLFCGIKTGDGWFNLIRSLCRIIQIHVNNQNNNGSKIIKQSEEKLYEVNLDELDNRKFFVQPEIIQIKSNMGGLRFYLSGGDGYIFGAITLAEDLSFEVCEFCGSPGRNQLIDVDYITVCPACKEREYESKTGPAK